MKSIIFVFLLASFLAHAQKSTNLLDGDHFDLEIGPGYTAGVNIRYEPIDPTDPDDDGGNGYSGFWPLYYLRIPLLTFTNVVDAADFLVSDGFKLGIITTIAGDDYAEGGLDDRDKSLFMGGFIGYGILNAWGYADTSAKSHGAIYGVALAPSLYKSGKNRLTLVFKAEHLNRPYMEYYYGVTAQETAVSSIFNTVYTPEAATNYTMSIVFNAQISSRWRFIIFASGTTYDDEVFNSPTVERDFGFTSGIGWMYKIF